MLVLNLEDGSPYVFPSKIEMDAQISTMKGNTKQADVGSVIQDLQKIAASEGSAEKLRLNWLKKVIKLRLKVITSTPSLSVAGSRVTAANKAEAPIGEFIQKNINSPALPHVDLSALGFQSFSTSAIQGCT